MPSNELSAREQKILWLYGYEGLTAKAVAAAEGLGAETVKSYLKRIRAKLWAKGVRAGSRADLLRAALTQCWTVREAGMARAELVRAIVRPAATR